MAPSFSLAARTTPRSVAASPDPAQAARARRRCSSIAASKPAVSTPRPCSRSASCVRSSGKPNVSYRRNATSPGSAPPSPQPLGRLGEQVQAALQHRLEPRLLEPQRLHDQRLGAHQFRVGGAHLAHQRRHQAPHQRLARAHHVRVPHRAAHDPAQHVAAALVGGQHAVGDQERAGAQVVGDHPVADLEFARPDRWPVASALARIRARSVSVS